MTVNEDRLIRERKKGAKAEALWEGLEEIFTRIEENHRLGWKNSLSDEQERREEIYRSMRNLDAVKSEIRKMIATGRAAAKQLEKDK